MSEYLQQLFAELPEAVRHVVVLHLQHVVQRETLISAITTTLGEAGHIGSHPRAHVESNPPMQAVGLPTDILWSPTSSVRCDHTVAHDNDIMVQQNTHACPPLVIDSDDMHTAQLLNARTTLKQKLLLCRARTKLWELYTATHRCTTCNQVSIEMIDAFTNDAADILRNLRRQLMSSIRDRCTGGFEMMLQSALGVTSSLCPPPPPNVNVGRVPHACLWVSAFLYDALPSCKSATAARHFFLAIRPSRRALHPGTENPG